MVWTEKDSNALNISGVSSDGGKAKALHLRHAEERQELCAGLQIVQFRIDNAERSL